VARPAAG